MKRVEEAHADLDRALEVYSRSMSALFLRGLMFHNGDKKEQAFETWRLAHGMDAEGFEEQLQRLHSASFRDEILQALREGTPADEEGGEPHESPR